MLRARRKRTIDPDGAGLGGVEQLVERRRGSPRWPVGPPVEFERKRQTGDDEGMRLMNVVVPTKYAPTRLFLPPSGEELIVHTVSVSDEHVDVVQHPSGRIRVQHADLGTLEDQEWCLERRRQPDDEPVGLDQESCAGGTFGREVVRNRPASPSPMSDS